MTLRRNKMKKVLEIRERTLQERAGALSQAHEGRAAAQAQASSAVTHLQQAADYRQQLASSAIDVATWIDAEQWLVQRSRQNNVAQTRLQGAEVLVAQAFDGVIVARSNVKRIELLDQRLAEQETRRQDRLEQKANDEHAQRKFAMPRRAASD
jgi:flagellar biosynthesis chaperone FliJ